MVISTGFFLRHFVSSVLNALELSVKSQLFLYDIIVFVLDQRYRVEMSYNKDKISELP